MRLLGIILATVFVLMILGGGGLEIIFGIIAGVVGLVVGLLGAAVGLVAGLFGALIGLGATLFVLAIPLLIIGLVITALVHIFA